jgi:hypothetical protein
MVSADCSARLFDPDGLHSPSYLLEHESFNCNGPYCPSGNQGKERWKGLQDLHTDFNEEELYAARHFFCSSNRPQAQF